MPGDVFEENPVEAGAEFTGDPGNIGPEMALVIGPLALPSGAERLAGVSGEKGVEGSGERPSVEGCEVVPDRGRGEVSGLLGGDEDAPRVFLPFDIASRVEAGFRETEAHIQAAAACAEGEAVFGTWHHVIRPSATNGLSAGPEIRGGRRTS